MATPGEIIKAAHSAQRLHTIQQLPLPFLSALCLHTIHQKWPFPSGTWLHLSEELTEVQGELSRQRQREAGWAGILVGTVAENIALCSFHEVPNALRLTPAKYSEVKKQGMVAMSATAAFRG